MSEDLLAPLEQPQLLSQRVYQRLEEMIIRGRLEAGQHLVETELATMLGVSRNPVREALQGLQRIGWVELRPRQGAFVRQPTAAEVEGFFRVRAVLEVESARSVARNATEDDVQRLREILTEGEEAISAGDEQRLVDVNSRFHEEMARLANNPVLRELLGQLDRRLRWYLRPVASQRAPDSWSEHKELVDAFARGAEEEAAEIADRHVAGTAKAYEASAGLVSSAVS